MTRTTGVNYLATFYHDGWSVTRNLCLSPPRAWDYAHRLAVEMRGRVVVWAMGSRVEVRRGESLLVVLEARFA